MIIWFPTTFNSQNWNVLIKNTYKELHNFIRVITKIGTTLYWLLCSMSGFMLTMSGFLSTIRAKDMAIGASLTSMSGSLSTISGLTKNGDIQLQWMSLTIQLFGFGNLWVPLLSYGRFCVVYQRIQKKSRPPKWKTHIMIGISLICAFATCLLQHQNRK